MTVRSFSHANGKGTVAVPWKVETYELNIQLSQGMATCRHRRSLVSYICTLHGTTATVLWPYACERAFVLPPECGPRSIRRGSLRPSPACYSTARCLLTPAATCLVSQHLLHDGLTLSTNSDNFCVFVTVSIWLSVRTDSVRNGNLVKHSTCNKRKHFRGVFGILIFLLWNNSSLICRIR